MDLTPATTTEHGYVPTPAARDTVPQLRGLSTNDCPNSSPFWLTSNDGSCAPGLTAWGYCHACWEVGAVPAVWAARVDAAIDRINR